ncbi:hypothetical protein B6U79_01810 [Candidatus Bathyarchaeota archaeon ex4484_231]|nr:MAG: hypothetical protein B6U79_01810 [Candidatus Bathyarchaeota archaeon ex4484_231]
MTFILKRMFGQQSASKKRMEIQPQITLLDTFITFIFDVFFSDECSAVPFCDASYSFSVDLPFPKFQLDSFD